MKKNKELKINYLDAFIEKKISVLRKKISKKYIEQNEFFISEKIFKNLSIKYFLYSNIFYIVCRIIVFGYNSFNNLIAEIIVLNVFLLFLYNLFCILSFLAIIFVGNKRVKRIKKRDLEGIKFLYHVTTKEAFEKIYSNGIYNIKPTKFRFANIEVFFRKSTYLFTSIPNEKNIKEQGLKNRQGIIIQIPIENIDIKKSRLRKNFNVLVYMKEYIGTGSHKEFKIEIESK